MHLNSQQNRYFFGSTLLLVLVNHSFAYYPNISELEYNKNYTFYINNSIEYILGFTDNIINRPTNVPPRIWIKSNATTSAPLMINARQTKEMLSWQLPLEVEKASGETLYNYTSRTLCHDILKHYKLSGRMEIKHDSPIVSVATASNELIEFTINVHSQKNFYIEHSKEYNFTVSPSEPRYFFYNFSTNVSQLVTTDSNYETVILEVTSDDDICMTVSIQNISCPVFDTNQDVTFRGYYETVNKKGGITISKHNFPHGFYVVFVAKPDDYQCNRVEGVPASSSNPNRIKHLTLVIKPSITYTDYVTAVILTLCCIGGFYVVFGLSYFICAVRGTVPRQMAYVADNINYTPNSRVVKMEARRKDKTGTDILWKLPVEIGDIMMISRIRQRFCFYVHHLKVFRNFGTRDGSFHQTDQLFTVCYMFKKSQII